MYPMAWMLENKMVPDQYFSEVLYLGSHQAVLEAVLDNSVDAGTVSPTPLKLMEQSAGALFIRISKFGPIPTSAVAAAGNMSDLSLSQLAQAVTHLPLYITENENFPFAGFIRQSDDVYDQMRTVIELTR